MGNVTLIPSGRQQFTNANGVPYSGATVGYYIPGTLTPKSTYQDPNGTVLNLNPVKLDQLGSAAIWGTGSYRQILKDATGKLVWDQVTIAPQLGGGTGELFLANVAAGQAASIAAGTSSLTLLGYNTPGDGGGATYILTTGPSGPGKFQSADGQWWMLSAPIGNIRMFGAMIDGVTDDTAAWTSALAWAGAAAAAVYHPGGNSIVNGALALDNQSIYGVDSFKDIPGRPITQTSTVTFHGNNAGLVLAASTSGGFTLEKIGFVGIPGTYTHQIGLYMNDGLRLSQNEGWPTLRDVSFRAFSYGIIVGNNYQTGYVYNTYVADSVINGYQNFAEDWYHYGMYCGSSTVVASGYQLLLGPPSPAAYGSGAHQFIGGAFFGAQNTIGIVNSSGNIIVDAYIQNANDSGIVIGDGTNAANNNLIEGCVFSGNNQAGGALNVNGKTNYDIWLRNNCRETRIHNCRSAAAGAGTFCVAAGIAFEGPNNDSTMISGVQFNMDNIVTPATPTVPVAIQIPAAMHLVALDHLLITDNLASYGEQGVYTFEQRSVDMVSVSNPYTVVGTLMSVKAGSGYISGAINVGLPNPNYTGRPMRVSGVNGSSFTCATSGALGSSHTNCTFAAGGYIDLLSISATTWQVCATANTTLT